MSKILIVDDDVAIRKMLSIAFKSYGFDMVLASTLEEAILQSTLEPISLVILDLMIAKSDGKEFIKKFREWSNAPIIVLSARSAEGEKLACFDLGADDYVTKPFSIPELIARVKVAIKRFSKDHQNPIINSGDLQIDISSHTATLLDVELKLTPKEFELLKLLVCNSGKILTHSWPLKEIWGMDYQNETQYLRVFIKQLRQKIEEDSAKPRRIITETGIGYRFVG